MFFFLFRFLQSPQTNLAHDINKFRLDFFRFLTGDFYGFQFSRYNALGILLLDFANPFDRNGVLLVAVRKNIPHQIAENVFFNEDSCAFCNLDCVCIFREMLKCIKIGV